MHLHKAQICIFILMSNEQKPVLIFDHLYYLLCLTSIVSAKTIKMYINILKEEMLREYSLVESDLNKALPVYTPPGCRVSS